MIFVEHVSLTLLTSFLSVYALGKWSPPGIFRKVYLHVIWVPTMITLFSYDVFKYRSSSKTHRQKRMLRVWEIIGQVCHKRPPNHRLGEFVIIYIDRETSFRHS